MRTDSAVVFRDVLVKYGTVTALDGLDLSIPEKGVFGLLGRNGAGKTTAIRAITGLVWLSAGVLNVFGENPWKKGFQRDRISVLFAEDGLAPFLTVHENLSIWAGFHGFGKEEAGTLTREILLKLGIEDLKQTRVSDLSTGNRRIVAVARTFMLPSDMVILDEPTSSLDPVRASEVREAIKTLSKSRLVLLSTHNLSEAEELSDTVAIIDSGKLILSGKPGELDSTSIGKYTVRTEEGSLLFRGESYSPGERGFVTIRCADPPADILAEFIESGNRIIEFKPFRKNLSSIFMELTGKNSR
ncbi:MAG: ABC transporter ATP-binding protein [Candidatus Aegiribacteria sp.]|nr:ABC transporter ATP-binding protein [Candidatus Aegiribacteria sp.]